MIYLTIPLVAFVILSALAIVSFRWASTHSDAGDNLESGSRGCLVTLASLLLRPIPVLFAFYQFGFLTAVVVALAIWLAFRCFDIFKGKLRSLVYPSQLVLPLGAGLTLSTGDFTFFQLVPSGWCVAQVLEQLDGLIRGKANIFVADQGDTVFSEDETRLARWGILGTSLVALLVSEYARHSLSLSGWLWYYGYLRLEVLPILLGALAPAMIKMMHRPNDE